MSPQPEGLKGGEARNGHAWTEGGRELDQGRGKRFYESRKMQQREREREREREQS